MWFVGEDRIDSNGYVGYAWSKNGFSWRIHPEAVMKTGKEDEWDAKSIYEAVKVLFDGKRYHMWYNAFGTIYPSPLRIGYATSNDGINWIKSTGNPVLEPGESGTWDDNAVSVHSVNFNGTYYEMWYDGFNLINTQVGYASSEDGINWIKSGENPVLRIGELGNWDTWIARIPVVISHDSIYKMWYYGHNNARGSIGYATTSTKQAWDTATINKAQRIIKVQVFNKLEYINVDSLAEILPGLSGTGLIDAFNRLALAYSLNDSKKSLRYAERALDLSKNANYPMGRASALYSIGNSQYVMDNYSDALFNHLFALRLFDSLEMQFERANLLSQIAGIHSYAGSHDMARRYHSQALDVFKGTNDTAHIMHSLVYLGYTNLWYGDTASAIMAFQEKLSLAKTINDKRRQVDSYEALGLCFSGRILDSALYYFSEANKIWNEQNSRNNEYNFLISAEACFAAGQQHYDEAEKLFLKAQKGINRQTRVRLLFGMAELYFNMGRYDKTIEFLDISLHECKTFLFRQNYQMFTHLNQKLENEISLKPYMEKIYRLYYRLDTALQEKDLAFAHYKLATQWKDSIQNEQNRRQWAMMQGQYETESAQSMITLLEKDNEVKDMTLKKSRFYLFGLGAFVLIIILGAIIYVRQRKIRAQHAIELERVKSEKLQELNQLKSRFFANISHEFRTPLTLIMGPLKKLLSRTQNEKDIKELGMAKKYAGKLQILINNLLAISKLESGKLQLRASETNIVRIIRSYLNAFESLAKQKNITLKFVSENMEIKAFIDHEKFEQILNNLLSNAFKFTSESGRIEIQVDSLPRELGGRQSTACPENSVVGSKEAANRKLQTANFDSGCLIISVKDNGLGIPPEKLPHIFDRFYQVGQEEGNSFEGTGIGLALTKELVELHYGMIEVESEVGVGTTFRIYLPLGSDHLKPDQIETSRQSTFDSRQSEKVDSLQPAPRTRGLTVDTETLKLEPGTRNQELGTADDIPVILIVEDNSDMRSYIRGYFYEKYHIIEAIDGADGYEKSIEHVPDIIISDVMMPNMDGIEFCGKIKEDERTSHIPVILLTAHAAKESRIEGLETGADDFITKPFDGDELQLRVYNLIKQRHRVRKLLERKIQKSHRSVQVDFEDSGITSMDEQFLQKVIRIVTEKYTDPQFNTTTFGQAIGLGRVQLNRKIKALTGQTTVSFIRTFRLNHAAELIKKKSATVAEIAYDVGFNNPSYFTECFRHYFGKLPSEFTGDDSI